MLIGKRRMGSALLSRATVYDLVDGGRTVGSLEIGPNRQFVEIDAKRYFILEQRDQTFLEWIVKQLFWMWRESYVLKDEKRAILATAEKSALNLFTLRFGGATFLVRPPQRLTLGRSVDVIENDAKAAIGDVQYKGVIGAELVSSLPETWSLPVRAFVMWMLVFTIRNAPGGNE